MGGMFPAHSTPQLCRTKRNVFQFIENICQLIFRPRELMDNEMTNIFRNRGIGLVSCGYAARDCQPRIAKLECLSGKSEITLGHSFTQKG